MIFNVICISSAVVYLAVFSYKFQHLRTNWGRPRLWALCASIFLPMLAVSISAPVNQHWINHVTGVANLSVLLLGTVMAGAAGSWLVLVLFWRFSFSEAWPRVRWVLVCYPLIITGMAVLFGLSDVPEERVRGDFAVYYAPQQPTIFAYFLIFLVAELAGISTLAFCCFTWAWKIDRANLPWLRRSLVLYGLSSLFCALYYVVGLASVIAAKAGMRSLDAVTTPATMVVSPLTLSCFAAAMLLPRWGPRWPAVGAWARRWRDFRTLRSLHRTLQPVDPHAVVVTRGKRLNPHHRVRRMVIELNDWQSTLAPFFDPAVGEAAEVRGREAGLAGEKLEAMVEAAQLRAAARAWRRGSSPGYGAANGYQANGHEERIRDGSSIEAELTWWIRVARAFRGVQAASS